MNAALDIGAVEAAPALVVMNSADSGPGSLRQTIADAPSGTTILFDTTVFDGTDNTIELGSLIDEVRGDRTVDELLVGQDRPQPVLAANLRELACAADGP